MSLYSSPPLPEGEILKIEQYYKPICWHFSHLALVMASSPCNNFLFIFLQRKQIVPLSNMRYDFFSVLWKQSPFTVKSNPEIWATVSIKHLLMSI